MQRIIISAALIWTLAGCTFFPGVHKIDIQQGNIVTQEMVDQLKPGMTKDQVRFVMGTPLIQDTFQNNRWDYMLTFKKGGEARTQERLSLFFADGKLSKLSGDFRPGATKSEQ